MKENVQINIDNIYASFVQGLPQQIQAIADDLPFLLGLTTHHQVPWSAIFYHPAVLAFPMFLFEDNSFPQEMVKEASKAYFFSIIGTFATDQEVILPEEAKAVVQYVLKTRDDALAEITPQSGFCHNYLWATQEALVAQMETNRFFHLGSCRLESYQIISRQKQAFAFSACLSVIAKLKDKKDVFQCVEDAVAGAALGLQYRSDVVDWVDDLKRNKAWPVVIHQKITGTSLKNKSKKQIVDELHRSKILIHLLNLSAASFWQCAIAAHQLKAKELAVWADRQAEVSSRLAKWEAMKPGYAVGWELDCVQKKAVEQKEKEECASVKIL